ncbi:MAG: hypothetical protein J5762_02505 [Clostridia bacterium]|nr:hypothetical protein [Clostridia bacterium]
MHYLFGKKVTVNYDGKDTIVQSTEEGDFFITVLPVKTATVVKVTVEDMPLED